MPDVTVDVRGARGPGMAEIARASGLAPPDATNAEAVMAVARAALDEVILDNPTLIVVSSLMQDVLAEADAEGAREILGALSAADTFTADNATDAASLAQRFGDRPNAIRDFGAKGDGVTDDTVALQAFFDACQAGKKSGTIPGTGSYYKVTAPISVASGSGKYVGDGNGATWIKASGNFSEVFNITATGVEKIFEDIWIDTRGTTTRCVSIAYGAQANTFIRCRFIGDLAGDLVYSQAAGYMTFETCKWECAGASTVGLCLDMYNQGTRIIGGGFGGSGSGMRIIKSGAGGRVEGTDVQNVQFLTQGTYAIDIGNSYLTHIADCNLDQMGSFGIVVSDGADHVQVSGNWIGMAGATGICLNFVATAGNGHTVDGNIFNIGAAGILVGATASDRVGNVTITNNIFSGHATYTISLDSVDRATITGNVDNGTPALGSWLTGGTFGAGSYIFDNNLWHTTAPGANFHAGSTYRFGDDLGIVGRKRSKTVVGGAATSTTISHGLFRTPSVVTVTAEGSVGAFNILNIGASSFDVAWGTNGTPTWHWEASV